MDSTFRRYKVHADIGGGSVAMALKRQLGGQNRRFLVISVAVSSEPLRVEASIIMQRHEVPYRLSSDHKILEVPFCTKICCHRRFN